MQTKTVKLVSWMLDYIHVKYKNLPDGNDLTGWSQLFKETDFTSQEALDFKKQWEVMPSGT